ncbi:hypothetical protein [Aquipuribacter sp. SD81]
MAPKQSDETTDGKVKGGGTSSPDRTSGPFIRPMSDPVSETTATDDGTA